ncbi:unnamed protein product [Ceratitis capitata]|uniref:(Mediterranean fruit fly) hypothetical protein n=1 Tax=Ceratitis capitata TaxID=7213 RepID=A0A811U3H5_CERCA|nr:unnamed protein product [Ceratitis capitata]
MVGIVGKVKSGMRNSCGGKNFINSGLHIRVYAHKYVYRNYLYMLAMLAAWLTLFIRTFSKIFQFIFIYAFKLLCLGFWLRIAFKACEKNEMNAQQCIRTQ